MDVTRWSIPKSRLIIFFAAKSSIWRSSIQSAKTRPGADCGSDGKASAYNAGHLGSIPGWERSSGEGNGNPLQYSCLENLMDGGAW